VHHKQGCDSTAQPDTRTHPTTARADFEGTMTNATVLVAEDNKQIREALERILKFEGYTVLAVGDGAAALEAVDQHDPDALILDVMMPFVDGMSVARKIRDRGDRRPILMLTARADVSDRVAGLDAGADDYLPKPFELDELLARVRALLRRSDMGSTETNLTAGDVTLDIKKRIVRNGEREIELTRTEFEILHLLMANPEIVMSRSVLYERIWGYDFETSSKSLDVHVGYFRRKLEEHGEPRTIHTSRGIGYVIRPVRGSS
jgi:two-component system response regulator MprA